MSMAWVGTKPGTFVNESTIVPISAGNLNALVNTLDAVVAGADDSGLNATTLQGFYKEGFATPSDQGLQVYYSFDDACNNLVIDDSISEFHGTSHNAVCVAGLTGRALSLNGTSSYVQGSYSTVTEFTLSAWFKGTISTTNNRIITIFNSSTSYKAGIFVSGSKAEFRIRNSGGTISAIQSVANVNDDVWNHICCTYDGTTAKIYINGKLEGSLTTTLISSYYNLLRIGCSEESTPSSFTAGLVDEVRLYSRGLTATEVAGLYVTKNGSKSLLPTTNSKGLSITLRKSDGAIEGTTFDLPEDENDNNFNLKLSNNSGLTADRKLTINVSDADKTIGIPLSGDLVTTSGSQVLTNKTSNTETIGDSSTKLATTAFATQSSIANSIKYAIVLG